MWTYDCGSTAATMLVMVDCSVHVAPWQGLVREQGQVICHLRCPHRESYSRRECVHMINF